MNPLKKCSAARFSWSLFVSKDQAKTGQPPNTESWTKIRRLNIFKVSLAPIESGRKISIGHHLTLFLAKRVENWQNPVVDHFLVKKGSNVARLKLWNQIWNLLVIWSLHDPFLLKFLNFAFFRSPLQFLKKRLRTIFFEFKIFYFRFGISVQKT